MRLDIVTAAAFLVLLVLGGCVLSRNGKPPLETVAQVNLERYAGRWYEIARYPHRFEEGCSAVTADYSLAEDGVIEVVNQCRRADGTTSKANGRAKIAAGGDPAKLRVTFFWPFYGDYWILKLDDDYQWAVVGAPSRKYVWILGRQPRMEPRIQARLIEEIAALGYDPSRLILTDQSSVVH